MREREFSENVQFAVCLIMSALLVLLIGLPAHAQEPPLEGLDAYIEEAMRQWEVPGLAIAVVKDDEIVLAKGYGLRDIGAEAPVDEHTVFAIASVTKSFTAAALAMLVDEGKLGWDDPVTDYLPDFQLYDPWVTREVTVRDLLSHRTGLPGVPEGEAMWYVFGYDSDETLHRLRYLKPASSFRSRYGYQNVTYLAAGRVVEAVSGQSWDDFVTERIFGPLGMAASKTSAAAVGDAENVALPHARTEGQVQPVWWDSHEDIVAPAGSINSTVLDLAQWLRLQLGEGEYEGEQLLSSASAREMHTAQTIIHPRDEPLLGLLAPDASFAGYGLGWMMYDYEGRNLVEHSGGIDGWSSLVSMLPQENLGLVVLTNLDFNVLTYALKSRVFDAFLGLPERDWSAEILEVFKGLQEQAEAAQKQLDEARVEGTSPSLPLPEYAGTYLNDRYEEIAVTTGDGELVMKLGPAAFTGVLEHWQYDTFRAMWRDRLANIPSGMSVTFTLDALGKVGEMEVQMLGAYQRVPVVGP